MKPEKVFSYTDIDFYTLDIKLPSLLKRKILARSNREKTIVAENFCHEGEYSENNLTRIGEPGVVYGEAAFMNSLSKDMIALYPFKAPIQSCVTLVMKSNAALIPHVDAFEAGNWRRICLSWALQPSYENFAPTVFHNDRGDEIYKHYYDEKAFVLDTRIMHSVTNNDHTRVIFQVTFDAELTDII